MGVLFQRSLLTVALLAAVTVSGFLLFLGGWGLSLTGDGETRAVPGVCRSERGRGPGFGSFASWKQGGGTPMISVGSGGEAAAPRVTPLADVVPPSTKRPDAEEKSGAGLAPGGAAEAERLDRIKGLRRRLLMEAAERALDSETPWVDLSLVALGFKRIGDDRAALYWFKRAGRLAFDPDDARNASRALREVIKNAAAARYFDFASELSARIPDGREKAMARAELAKAHARGKEFGKARELALSLSDERARGLALRGLAEAQARFEGFKSALATLQLIKSGPDRDRALGSVASVRASQGDSDGAMMLLEGIENPRVRDATVAKIATIQERGGAVSIEALAGLIHDPTFRDEVLGGMIVEEASRLGVSLAAPAVERIETGAGRAKAYESLVMLQIRRGNLQGALSWAQSIHVDEVRSRALQAVAVAEVREGGTMSARNIANLIGEPGMREKTFGKIAWQAAVEGRHRGAVDTIHFIDDPAERAGAFATVALTQARYGLDRSALLLAQDVRRELSQIEDRQDRVRAQGLLAEVFAETGEAATALATASGIDNARIRDTTYQRVALSFARENEPALATSSARLIERETVREKAFDTIARILASRVPLTQAVRYAARLDGHSQQVRFLLGVAARKS